MKRLIIALTLCALTATAGPMWSLDWSTADSGYTPYKAGDLLVYWNFNEGDGSSQDNLGTLGATGDGVQTNVALQCSVANGYGTFGADSMLTSGSGIASGLTNASFGLWVRAEAVLGVGTAKKVFFCEGGATDLYLQWYRTWGSVQELSGNFFGSTISDPYAPRNSNEWYHICCTHDGSVSSGVQRTYINGTNTDLNVGIGIITWRCTAAWDIGYSAFDGDIDEMRIYEVTLDQADIDAIIAEERP